MRATRVLALAAALAWAAGTRAQGSGTQTGGAGQDAGAAAQDQGQQAQGQARQAQQPGQQQAQPQGQQQAQQQQAQHEQQLASQCVDLLRGEASGQDPQLRSRCEGLIRQGASVTAGQGNAAVAPGPAVASAFNQAGQELVGGGPRTGLGMTTRGPVRYTLWTDPIGWFTGLGTNLAIESPFETADKFSWVAGLRYSSTSATNGRATAFGAEAGADFFIIGHNNAGLRIGPRLELALGQENFGSTNTFGRLGLGGELGYNFIASNGLTGMAALGLGGRLAGNQKNTDFNSFTGGDFGPYFKLGIGYSW